MLKIQSLLQSFFSSFKKVSKKAYKQSLIITTGCAVVAIVSLTMKSFDGGGKNNVTSMVPIITEEQNNEEEDDMEAKILTALNENELASQSSEEFALETISASQAEIQKRESITLLTAQQSNGVVQDQLIHLPNEDYEALLRIVEAEATGEDIIGKVLVANVVLNRVESKNFPNTIYDVVHDKKGGIQFSPIADGRYYSVQITEDTKLAVERALKGEDYSEGALFFVARSLASKKAVSWFDKNLTKVVQHGVHEFYTY